MIREDDLGEKFWEVIIRISLWSSSSPFLKYFL
jgi:hypothetical protein